ncbi:MAG: lysophospholipid acyltransferase family protein [Bacillota bacterium]
MFYSFARLLCVIFIKLFFRLKIHGAENIPGRKPFIVCSNHLNWIDPVVVGVAIPGRYQVHFMAKKELFSNFIFAFTLRCLGAFPLNRQDADYAAIRKAYQVLQNGQVLGLFPEGSRSKTGKLKKAYNGTALIAVRSGVPLLPVAITGPYRLFKPLHVKIGPPFALPPLIYDRKYDKRAQLEKMSAHVMKHIANLLPEDKIEDAFYEETVDTINGSQSEKVSERK